LKQRLNCFVLKSIYFVFLPLSQTSQMKIGLKLLSLKLEPLNGRWTSCTN